MIQNTLISSPPLHTYPVRFKWGTEMKSTYFYTHITYVYFQIWIVSFQWHNFFLWAPIVILNICSRVMYLYSSANCVHLKYLVQPPPHPTKNTQSLYFHTLLRVSWTPRFSRFCQIQYNFRWKRTLFTSSYLLEGAVGGD